MKIKQSALLYQLSIIVSFFTNYELTLLTWLLFLFISIKERYSSTLLRYVAVFSAIAIIGIVSSFFYSYPFFWVIRDLSYFIKPMVGLLLGYQLYRFDSDTAFKVFIKAGFFLAVIHLCLFGYAFLRFRALNMNLIRAEAGFFSDYEVYVLILLIFHEKFELKLSRKKRLFYTWIVGFSCFMYLARTNFIQFAILFLAMKGYFLFTIRNIKILAVLSLSVLLGYSALVYYRPKRNGQGLEGLMYKIKIIPEEAFKTKINKEDWKDFNDNYRSFENILTVKHVTHDSKRAIMFGTGLGSRLNIGQKILTTDGSVIQFIPIVHNGFMTVFLKSGFLGVSLLFIFIYLLFKQKRHPNPLLNNVNLLLMGTGIFLLVSNWVFLGLYFKLDNKSIVIGFLVALRESLLIQQASSERNTIAAEESL